ncbi:MAG TPA: dinitrogenase iron-molybdenum cofactor biosynthesis protein [Candidatus Riflebacteria bacterium]|jgi:predicted Fe-Mo cluster-binding NifX family protein|nr:dinitrogenase iron-molybdenum cofactor biosynthesis protein [Candidatus Riflebacteria bacterium]
MKFAVSVREQNVDAKVDLRFGRAQMFALYDSKTGECSWHPNTQNFQAAQGAGIQTAQNVVNLGAEAVISGHCGPKAYRVLEAAGVHVYSVVGNPTLKEAVQMIESGKIKAMEGADVEGHWV